MARFLEGGEPLPEPGMTQFTDENIDGLVQERRNSSAWAMELRLSCTDPSIYSAVLL